MAPSLRSPTTPTKLEKPINSILPSTPAEVPAAREIVRITDLDTQTLDTLDATITASLGQHNESLNLTHDAYRWPLHTPDGFNARPFVYEYPIDITSLEIEFGLDSKRLTEYLDRAVYYGDDNPAIYCYGSAARSAMEKVKPDYRRPPRQKAFDPQTSDLDLLLPESLLDDPRFLKQETTWTVPAPGQEKILFHHIRLIEDIDKASKLYHLFSYRTANTPPLHPLHLSNVILPNPSDQPLIEFTLDSRGILQAKAIAIQHNQELLDPYDPKILGMKAYNNGLVQIAAQLETGSVHPNPTTHTNGMQLHNPEALLIESIRTWSQKAVELANRRDPELSLPGELSSNHEFDSATRELALQALSICVTADLLFETYKDYPEEAIYLLGQSGLLSLVMQASIFIGINRTDTLGKFARLFTLAMKYSEDSQNRFHTTFRGARSNTKYKRLIDLSKELSRTPETGKFLVDSLAIDTQPQTGTLTITPGEWVSYYPTYLNLAREIAQLDPLNFQAYSVPTPIVKLSDTILAADREPSIAQHGVEIQLHTL